MKLKYPYSLGATLLIALIVGLLLPSILLKLGIQFGYEEGISTVVCVLISLGAAALSFFMYRKSSQLIPNGIAIPLGVFRYLVMLMVSLLLLEPKLETKEKVSAPPVVAVLHDNTESMVIHRDSQYVQATYPGQIKKFVSDLNTEQVSANFFGFGQQLEADIAPDSLRYLESGTNISGALQEAGKLYSNQNLGAIVLVSDGISTSGVNPLYTLDQFQIPVYTVLVGDTTPQKDVRVSEVLYNQIAYLDNETPVKVKIATEGYEAASLIVKIQGQGKVLGSQIVPITKDAPDTEVDFMVSPPRTGILQYTVSVSPLADEITTRNNYKSIFINVLETKVKIALFGGFPHPDIGALRNAFERDDRYEVTEFIHKSPADFYNDPERADWNDFDLFILHNFPFNQSDGKVLEQIKAQVKDNKTPLMSLVGKYTRIDLLQSYLGDYLGIVPGSQIATVEEAQLNFKEEYTEHSTFTFDDSWIRMMNNAPPIFRNQSEWKASGDTRVFATARIKGIALDYPVYGLQNHLGRKNMVFIGENLWRTRAHAFVEGGDLANFDQWIYNNIQWLIVKEDKRRFKVQPSKRLFAGQEPVLFRGEAYDESYNPLPGVDIKLKVQGPDGKENEYFLNETGNARYFLELSNLEEGTYQYTAEGTRNEAKIGSDRGEFSVGKSNIEHFRLTADRGLLEQIALRTGGKMVHARDLEQLAPEILGLNSLKPVVTFLTRRIGFNDYVWIFYVLLGLLALEWVVRKRYSLS